MIIIVSGLPASGKSYFASRLAALIGAEYINSDKTRKQLFTKRTYSDKEKSAVYDEMLAQAGKQLQQKKNVVLDATFHKNSTRRKFVQELDGNGIFFIEVWAEDPLIQQRLQQPRPWSEADFKVYTIIKQLWEPITEPHLRLQSTNNNISDMLQQAAAYLPGNHDK